jgi:hypothetical protein
MDWILANPGATIDAAENRSQMGDNLLQVAVWGSQAVRVRDSQGRVTGVLEDWSLEEDIPNASIRFSGAGTLIVLPADETYGVQMQAYSAGQEDVWITMFGQEAQPTLQTAVGETISYAPIQRATFVGLSTASGGRASTTIVAGQPLSAVQLAVDDNGDGAVERTVQHTSVLEGAQLNDYASPVTRISVEGNQDVAGYYTGNVTISLHPSDTGTGVLRTEYSVDGGGSWQLYSAALTMIAEDAPTFYARSVDRAGNWEYPWSVQRLRSSDSNTLPGDADGNCKVDLFDLVLVAKNYGTPLHDPRADVDGSGSVDLFDLVLVGKDFGRSCSGS